MDTGSAVIQDVRFFLAHTPGMVRLGSKPSREIPKQPDLLGRLRAHSRSYEAALAYPPNQVFLGLLKPHELETIPRPWYAHQSRCQPTRFMPHGELMPEDEFYGVLKMMDQFDLIWLEEGFLGEVRARLAEHPYVTPADLAALEKGHPLAAIVDQIEAGKAVPLERIDGTVVGCCNRAHEEDDTLSGDVLLENLACLATATWATRTLVHQTGLDPTTVPYVVNSGEEAVGDRYQRGGGNVAKAVAERAGLLDATGSDIKAFCCGPNHALALAAGVVSAGVFEKVVVVGGCSVAKLGMKALGHLAKDMPILEDLLAGFAILVGRDDGVSPTIRLQALGRHTVRAKSSQQAILEKLVAEPLEQMGLRFTDVDRYATELHNPEITEPTNTGNVPLNNYKMIAGLAVMRKQLAIGDMPAFVRERGMPGFSPTQGHVASAIPYLGHALDELKSGSLRNTLFLAKGSLFLGRMTQLSDGLSFLLERNPAAPVRH